jgi:hypothetical protein
MRRAALLALALAACSRGERELGAAVRAYDDELVRAYRTGDTSGLARLARPKEARKVRVLVDLKSASRLVLESSLEAFEVVRVERGASPDAAAVETRERWRYTDRHLDPGAPPGPTIVSEMTMRYALVREGGGWKVQEVTTLESRRAEEPPGAGRDAPGGPC